MVVWWVVLVALLVVSGEDYMYKAYFRYFDTDASPRKLKARLRQLALDFHPDKGKSEWEKEDKKRQFIWIKQAFDVLLERAQEREQWEGKDPDEERYARAREAQEIERRRRDQERRRAEQEEEIRKQMEEEQQRAKREEYWRFRDAITTEGRELERLYKIILSTATLIALALAYCAFGFRGQEDLFVSKSERQKAIATSTNVNKTMDNNDDVVVVAHVKPFVEVVKKPPPPSPPAVEQQVSVFSFEKQSSQQPSTPPEHQQLPSPPLPPPTPKSIPSSRRRQQQRRSIVVSARKRTRIVNDVEEIVTDSKKKVKKP